MRILCFSSREWGQEIFKNLFMAPEFKDDDIIIVTTKKKEVTEFVDTINPDAILFCGWSWMVSPEVTSQYLCIGLHPSPLPMYQGGSPIQNQIRCGEETSAVSLFEMTGKLDAGGILFQEEISLDGHIDDIFKRIISVGTVGLMKILKEMKASGRHPLHLMKTGESFVCKRLKNNSEITIEELQNISARTLYDKIRMLSGFFPNAYFTCKDGRKLYIEKVRLGD